MEIFFIIALSIIAGTFLFVSVQLWRDYRYRSTVRKDFFKRFGKFK